MNRIRRLIFITIIVSLGIQTQAQTLPTLDWQSGPDLPATRAEGVAVLAPDNATIVLGGISPEGSRVVRKLATGSVNWTTASDLDTDRVSLGAVRLGAGNILVYGGTGGGEASNEALAYDYSFGDSQDLAQMGLARRQFSFAADSLGNAYAIGGLDDNGDVLFDVEYYDSGLGSWIQIIDLPGARFASSAFGDTNGNVFVFGGDGNMGIANDVYCYSTTEESWVELAPMPVAVRNSAAVFSEGLIFVLGGISVNGPEATVQVYDLASGLWSIGADLPATRYSHAALVNFLGQIVVIGGYDINDEATSTVYHSQSLIVPESIPLITSVPITDASLDRFYTYDVDADGNPTPSFSLVQAPMGMNIDSQGGLISWQPVEGEVGFQDVTVRASNRVGDADQMFTITVVTDTFPPTAPTNLQVDAIGTTSVDLSWLAASDNFGVDHYDLYSTRTCGTRFTRHTCYDLVLGNIVGTSATVSGLTPLSSASYVIRAMDAAGNESANSNKVTFQTLSAPTNFNYNYLGTLGNPIDIPAKSLLEFQLVSSANPTATYTITSGPVGMTCTSTGLVQWTPGVYAIDSHTVIFQAANSVGSVELGVAINVRSDAPQLSVVYNPAIGGTLDATAGLLFTAQINDASQTPPTYELITAPTGMTIDPVSGLISWTPLASQAGTTDVLVHAINDGGGADLAMNFYTHFTGAVSNILVSDLTALYPTATWSAPTGEGANQISGYTIVATSRYRWGSRSWRTDTQTYDSPGTGTQFQLTGLTSGRLYKLYINAYDASGNLGLKNPTLVEFASIPSIPNVGWSVSNGSGGGHVVAEQAVIIQLTDFNTTSTSIFSIVNAPAGLTINSATGEALWTPTVSDIGAVSIALRAANDVGPRDVVINMNVLFSGLVQNAIATRVSGTYSAFAAWTPPADNVVPIVSYKVTRSWTFAGSHRASADYIVTGTSLSITFGPTGSVSHKGVTITPIDALGRLGATTPLIRFVSVPAPPPPPPVNVAPVANAGVDQTIALPHTAVTLNGSVADDGLPNPPGALISTWSVVSGPGPVILGNANAATTTATFSIDGVYTLRLAVSDSVLSHQDDLIVSVHPEPVPVNAAPVANAGVNQEIIMPNDTVNLIGSATDDGLPAVPGALTSGWSVVSGPGTVTFGDANAVATSASFSVEGAYTLRLSVSDGELSQTADLVVTVNPEPVATDPGTPPPYDLNAEQIELEGVPIQGVGVNYIVVSGVKVWYTSSTVIKFEEGNGNSFAVGQSVQLKASQNGDGSATANKIQVGG